MSFRRRNSSWTGFGLPLMTFAICFATSSAAAMFGDALHESASSTPQKRRIVGSGNLTGTRELQRVVTWQTSNAAHLAIETAGPHPRILWEADERVPSIDINSVRIIDLDRDEVPEIVGLWWKSASAGAVLRVFHWDRKENSFVELHLEDEPSRVVSYRLVRASGTRSSSRIAVYVHSESSDSRTTIRRAEYEMRGQKLVRAGGGGTVTTQYESGIEGQAVISPTRPGPVREGQTTTAPYKTTLVVARMSDGIEVARLETGSDGRFRVALSPGSYKVGPPPRDARFLPRGGQEVVTVVAGKFAHVTISFDSGMR